MIYVSAVIFGLLYIALLAIVVKFYLVYKQECKEMEAGKNKDNDEWRLVHKLMGQSNSQQLRSSFTQLNRKSRLPVIDYTAPNAQSR